jgi:hypothetical protein
LYSGLPKIFSAASRSGLHRRQAAGSDGWFDCRCRNAHVLRFDRRPLAGALLAGLVEDHVDHRAAGDRVGRSQDLFGDLDQVGVQAALVPVAEDAGDVLGALAETVAQDAVDFGDHLHVGIFDAVVDGLDEVAGAVIAEPRDARVALVLGSNRGQHRLDALPAVFGAADHDRRTMARTFFAARHAHADEGQVGVLEAVEAGDRVAEIGIAGIDHDVALGQMRAQQFHLLIDRLAGLDHDDDRARRADRLDELLDRLARNDLLLQIAGALVELIRLSQAYG